MAGTLDFVARFGTEEACIAHLTKLRWPGGHVCSKCGGRAAWRLTARFNDHGGATRKAM